MDWDKFVTISSQHLVLPAVYCRLKSRHLTHILPNELEIYLESITEINRNRNRTILEEAREISSTFKTNNIDFVFLKGTALISGGYYKDIAERMIGDIDILVEEKKINFAFNLLLEKGYFASKTTFGEKYFEHKHMPRLLSHKKIAAVELHHKLLIGNFKFQYLKTKSFLGHGKHGDLPIPSIQNLFYHNILNHQINDRSWKFLLFSLRNSYDTDVLSQVIDKEALSYDSATSFEKFLYNSYLSIFSKFFFIDTKFSKHYIISKIFDLKTKYPRFNKSYNYLVRAFSYFSIILDRIKTFIKNKNYRADVLNDRQRVLTLIYQKMKF